MSDIIIQPNGEKSSRHMGGPAFFALSGVRLWTDDCLLAAGTGADYAQDYGPWMDLHGIPREHIRTEAEHVSCYQIAYREDGTSDPRHTFSFYGDENMGYLKTHPRHLEPALKGARGVYMAQGADRVVWRQLAELRERYGFRLMWELEYFNSGKDLERVLEAMAAADGWSLNHNEAAGLLGIDRENDEAMLDSLQRLPVPFTFYRVGKRGAFAVTPEEAYFCPSVEAGPYVDQTGCGNCSTGAAMYGLAAGQTPAEILVTANVAAGFNCLQYGVFPHYTPQVREKALRLKEEYLGKVVRVR